MSGDLQLPADLIVKLNAVYRENLTPTLPPALWDWATTKLVVPAGESASLGVFSADKAFPFRRAMEIITARKQHRIVNPADPDALSCEELYICWSAQCGKTVSTGYPAFSWMAKFFPHQPMAFFWPSLDVRKAQMRDRLEPMWQATPDIAEILPPIGSEAYRSAMGMRTWKTNTGLRAGMRCGNIANDLRANPYCNIVFDEFDALKHNVGEQGDPMRLAIDRQRSFGTDALCIGVTTPSTVDGHGWRKLCQGTHERLMLECEGCGGWSWPNPDFLKPTSDDPVAVRQFDACEWVCPHCGMGYSTDLFRRIARIAMSKERWVPGRFEITEDVPNGRWVPSVSLDSNGRPKGLPEIPRGAVRSLHGNILICDVWSLGRFWHEEYKALNGKLTDKITHWNTARAEPFNENQMLSDIKDDDKSAIVVHSPMGEIPAWGRFVMVFFDQQGNTMDQAWFPYVIRAFGPDGRSILVEAGKTEKGKGFGATESLEAKTFRTVDGRVLRIDLAAMDAANGVMARHVREWAASKPTKRVLAWGNARLQIGEPYKVYVPGKRARLPWPTGVRGYEINSNYWRDRLDERRRKVPGAPVWEVPDSAPSFYLRSVWESEVRVVAQRQITGQGMREVVVWQAAQNIDTSGNIIYRRDGHWWDAEVNLCALAYIYGIDKLSFNNPIVEEAVKKIDEGNGPTTTPIVNDQPQINKPLGSYNYHAVRQHQARRSSIGSRRFG